MTGSGAQLRRVARSDTQGIRCPVVGSRTGMAVPLYGIMPSGNTGWLTVSARPGAAGCGLLTRSRSTGPAGDCGHIRSGSG